MLFNTAQRWFGLTSKRNISQNNVVIVVILYYVQYFSHNQILLSDITGPWSGMDYFIIFFLNKANVCIIYNSILRGIKCKSCLSFGKQWTNF